MLRKTYLGLTAGSLALATVAMAPMHAANASPSCNGANPSNNACAAFWYQAGITAGGTHVTVRKRVVVSTRITVKKRWKESTTKVRRVRVSTGVGGKSCAIFEQKGTGPLVAYAGYYRDRNNARVIGSVSPKWKKHGRYYRAVGCFDKDGMTGESVITVCGSVGHYEFDGAEARQFKRQSGPLGSDDIAKMKNGG